MPTLPPEYTSPSDPGWGSIPPQPPQRKKRHYVRTVILAILGGVGAVIVASVVAAILTSSSTQSSPGGHRANVAPASSLAASSAAPVATTPSAVPPQTIEFVITGDVPTGEFDEVDITYGSDTDSHQVTLNSLHGSVKYTVPFDASAEFYSVDVTIDGGQVACSIIATAPADNPLTVSHGSATGQNVCSAQAAPEDNGLNWSNEQ